MRELTNIRKKAALLDQTKKAEGTLVDGIQAIQKSLNARRSREAAPERVPIQGQGQKPTRGPVRL